MFKRSLLGVMMVTLALMTLWGCGSSRDSGGSTTTSNVDLGTDQTTGLAYVGAATCIGCHQGFSWSAAAVQNYLEGKHVIHSDHINAASGDCLKCHDPIGDGPTLESLISAANVPAEGLAAVGCENCHGAGGQHYGVGPIPAAEPDFNACGKCHNAEMDHNAYHPEGDNILEDYVASPHAASGDRPQAVCAKCHTDEGGRLYRNVNSRSRLETVVLPVENASAIQCRTCHDPHNPNKLLLEAVEDHGTVTASAEFATCTNCHQRPDAQMAVDGLGAPVITQLDGSTSTDGASGDFIYHATRYTRIIASTHYDDPATANIIEGYVVDPTNERACRDCHNVHASDTTINEQWAGSAHGGHLLTAKEAVGADSHSAAGAVAYREAGTTDAEAPAWTHYDWDAANRQGCQRCHTATGSKNFLSGPATYNSANNDFSHLEGWSKNATTGVITSSGQNEMLYCWACHKNNSGALRNPGAITEEYDPAVVVAYPDISSSNVCMSCHLGRETGAVIQASASDFSNTGFINSHYLSAGGQLFGETGYEYAGRNYNSVTFFEHDQIGTAAQPGTGEAGPCVACHMTSPEPHSFLPVTKDEVTGDVTAVTATVCTVCHTAGIPAAAVNTWKAKYAATLAILQEALEAQGIFWASNYPYFFDAAVGGSAVRNWTVGGTLNGKDTMGAAFNLNLLLHDPGGFAHNDYYVKALLWDAIDYINDGVLNNDVPATIAGSSLSAATITAASEYLGAVRPGDFARP